MPGRGRDGMIGKDTCWEENYSARGPLWAGSVHMLPALPLHARVLELGCGNGKTLSAMYRHEWQVTGIDISPRAVHLAALATGDAQECHLAVADIRRLPLRPGSFDAVFAVHVLGHLDAAERAAAVRELHRIILPGGQVFFRDFSVRDFRFGKGRETEPGTFLRGTGIRTHYFSEPEVLQLFTGFTAASIGICSWQMRVKGVRYERSEISAQFGTGPDPGKM